MREGGGEGGREGGRESEREGGREGVHLFVRSFVISCVYFCAAEWSSVMGRSGGGGGGGGGQPRYISRLDAIKEAVSRHLEHMAVTEPNNKVKVRNHKL